MSVYYNLITTAWCSHPGSSWEFENTVTKKRPGQYLADAIELMEKERPGLYQVVIVSCLPLDPRDAKRLEKLL